MNWYIFPLRARLAHDFIYDLLDVLVLVDAGHRTRVALLYLPPLGARDLEGAGVEYGINSSRCTMEWWSLGTNGKISMALSWMLSTRKGPTHFALKPVLNSFWDVVWRQRRKTKSPTEMGGGECLGWVWNDRYMFRWVWEFWLIWWGERGVRGGWLMVGNQDREGIAEL